MIRQAIQTGVSMGVPCRHVVVGEKRETSGRKSLAATALYTEDGTLVAAAEQVWIAVESADFA